MTLAEELRRRVSARSTIVGLHTALLELRESVDAVQSQIDGGEYRSLYESTIYDQGAAEGEELAKCTYLDEMEEHKAAFQNLRSTISGWGIPDP